MARFSRGCAERAEAIAAGAMRLAAGIARSKSTAPGMYGRRDSAGAATQTSAVISKSVTPSRTFLHMHHT